MIIDIHTHIFDRDWMPQIFWEEETRFPATLYRKTTHQAGKIEKRKVEVMWDPTGEKLIEEMNIAGIDISVMFGLDWALALGEPPVSIEEQNRKIAEIAERFPNRLIFFGTVDPRRKSAIDLLKKGFEEWGMKGVKIHPTTGFYPNDKAFYPIYERICEWNIPLLFHTGVILPPLRSKYARPIYLDDILVDFPQMNIIAAHLGTCWWEELAFMATRRTNLFMEISGWQQTATWQDPEGFLRILRRILDIAGYGAVLFGTDSPAYRGLPLIQVQDWVKLIKELPHRSHKEVEFTLEEIEAIMGRNAAMLLEIE